MPKGIRHKSVGVQLDQSEWESSIIHELASDTYDIINLSVSYLIFKEGTTYYAKNGNTGEIPYYGTTPSPIIQNAINSLTNGGTIFLKEVQLPGDVTYGNNILIIEDYQGERKVYSKRGSFRLQQLSTDPDITGWGTNEKGRWWFNSTSNNFKYWDSTSIKILGAGADSWTSTKGQITMNGTEQSIFEDTTFILSSGWIFFNTMAAGDIIQIRCYTKDDDGGTYYIDIKRDLSDAQTEPAWYVPTRTTVYGRKVTLKQTAGTFRTIKYIFMKKSA